MENCLISFTLIQKVDLNIKGQWLVVGMEFIQFSSPSLHETMPKGSRSPAKRTSPCNCFQVVSLPDPQSPYLPGCVVCSDHWTHTIQSEAHCGPRVVPTLRELQGKQAFPWIFAFASPPSEVL